MTGKSSDPPTIQPGEYEHYKGNHYVVWGVGRHSETDEYLVVYSPLYEADDAPQFWLRPYAMFTDSVVVDGETRPRFRLIRAAGGTARPPVLTLL